MRRILGLLLAILVGGALFYVSRFWIFSLWPRDGLFGIPALRPQGDLVAQWLRGTPLTPFELLIWAIGVFLVLTLAQRIFDLFNNDSH